MRILLIILDTVRADHLGPYDGPNVPTPNVDELAESGLVFEDCITGGPWTPPSHATMFTGTYPSTHGTRAADLTFRTDGPHLAEEAQRGGLTTQAIGSEPWLSRSQGFKRGFDRFHDRSKTTENLREPPTHGLTDIPALLQAGGVYLREVLRNQAGHNHGADRFGLMLLREWLSDKETFSFINIPVAHGPYDPPERFCKAVGASPSSGDPFVDEQNIHRYITGEVSPSEAAWDDLQALYAAGVVHADYLVGRLLERAPDDTWVILTADHGEHLGEHGRFGHQFSLYDELIRVPLIISHPSLDPRRRSDLVSHIDILPTIMNILDQNDNDTESTGRSLLAQPEEDRTVFAEYGPPAAHMNALNNNTNTINQETFDRLFRGIQAAITPKYKLLRYSDGTEELYHRDREGADALEKYPEVASDLRADMDRSLDGLPEVDESEFNDYVRGDVSDQLESLGYL